jgi:predicted transcriptional regulator
MIDAEISDAGIAVMCDIARVSGLDLDADKRAVLDELVAKGLVEVIDQAKAGAAQKYAVTPKGQRLLDKRGVGVNES